MKNSLKFLYLLFAFLLLYSYNDVMTSAQAGFRNQSRGIVHFYVGCIISLLGIYNYFIGPRIYRSKRNNSLSKILFLVVLWVTCVNIINSSDIWLSIIHLLMGLWWIMSYHFFFKFLENNPKSKKLTIQLFIGMFFFYALANLYVRNNIVSEFSQDFAITGYSYYFIVFVPFIGLIRNNKVRNALWIATLILVITSFKRGPIIIFPLMLLTYFFTRSMMTKKWTRFTIRLIPISLIAYLIFVWVDSLAGGQLSSRFNEEELSSGSGRVDMWTIAINSLKERDITSLLIGTGSGSSVELLGTGVHNEWLEFLFSFGIIGVILYFFMCIIMVRRYLQLIKQRSPYAPIAGMIVVYVITVGLFGGFFFVHSTFYVFAFLGLMESLNKKNNKRRYEINNSTLIS